MDFKISILAGFAALLATAAARAADRSVIDFNPGWRLATGDPAGASARDFDDSAWQPVTLPRAWNEDDAFRVSIEKHRSGIAWYRKTFTLPPDAPGRKVFIEFEGVRQGAEIWVNGRRAGLHENGVMAFGLDVSDLVVPPPAVNVIAVRTDNDWSYRERATGQRYQWVDRNFNANYGGIPKNVRLHLTGELYQTLPLFSNLGTTGTYVTARAIDIPARSATIHAESQIRNEGDRPRDFVYQVEIKDADGREIARFVGERQTVEPGATVTAEASATVTGLHFWSWGYGWLYDVTTSLVEDGKTIDPVVTRTGFRKTAFGNGVVKLNDRVIQMKGYAQRSSNEWPAIGMSVPPWLSDFSNRLMVESGANLVRWMHVTPWKQDVESCDRVGLIQAMPAGDAERDVTGRRWEQRLEVMRDAIIYNRNNPSILFYEGGNADISEEHMTQLKAIRDQYDPHGGRAIGSRDMLDSKVSEYGGEMLYINKSAGQPLWAMEYSRDEGLRKYWDEFSPPFHKDGDGPDYKGQDAAIYNRNQDSHAIENVVRWHDYWRERPGTGKRVSSGGVNIIFSDSNTHYRGAENYRRSGEVDPMRIPKDGFHAHRVMWDGWVDVEKIHAHIIGHWNYQPGLEKDIHVISAADDVELLLDGRSLGRGEQASRFLFTFPDVAWKPGKLEARGYDSAGKQVCSAEIETAGDPVALRLKPMTAPGGLRADGADLALVEVEVVDSAGRRCPVAMDMIDFEIDGPAEWRGGIAQGPDNFILARSLPVECGVNRVLVRSTTVPGKITVRARSGVLESAAAEIVSRAPDGGLPAGGLPSFLGRGPTPATPSVRPTRRVIELAGATAGSDPQRAAASFDDNEETSWASDNQVGTGWIEYTFAEPAMATEATLKLAGWRQRSYPIRITVDGEEVFRGMTPKSLGYVTLPLKPVTGRKLKIALLAKSEDGDAFAITELSNKENASTGADRVGRGTLAIVEAEFYEALGAP